MSPRSRGSHAACAPADPASERSTVRYRVTRSTTAGWIVWNVNRPPTPRSPVRETLAGPERATTRRSSPEVPPDVPPDAAGWLRRVVVVTHVRVAPLEAGGGPRYGRRIAGRARPPSPDDRGRRMRRHRWGLVVVTLCPRARCRGRLQHGRTRAPTTGPPPPTRRRPPRRRPPRPRPPPRRCRTKTPVLAAVPQGYWDTFLAANNPPNPNHPGIDKYMTLAAKDRTVSRISDRAQLGQAVRLPAGLPVPQHRQHHLDLGDGQAAVARVPRRRQRTRRYSFRADPEEQAGDVRVHHDTRSN